ncbi:24281_t:CDS:2, partial [Gigaspora margarita]
TLLENNPKYFSKNGFIYMTERSRDRGFTVEKPKRHFAHSNSIQKKGGRNVLLLSSDEVDEIFMNYSIYPQRGYRVYNTKNEFREKIAYSLFNGAKIIQRAWRAFKLKPETWAKQVWNMVRNDGTPDEKKFLGVILQKIKNPYTYQQYDLRSAKIIAIINKGYNYPLLGEYKEYYLPNNWIERKKEQLNNQLSLWLSNPEYYHINEFGNERSLEYARYMCKTHGKSYPCYSLKINYFETKYLYILGEEISIDFSDSNNNCEIQWNDLAVTSSTNIIDKQNEEYQAERDFQNKLDSAFIALKNKIRDDKISKYTNPVLEESADSKTKKSGGKKQSQGDHTKSASTSEPTISQNQPMPGTKKIISSTESSEDVSDLYKRTSSEIEKIRASGHALISK